MPFALSCVVILSRFTGDASLVFAVYGLTKRNHQLVGLGLSHGCRKSVVAQRKNVASEAQLGLALSDRGGLDCNCEYCSSRRSIERILPLASSQAASLSREYNHQCALFTDTSLMPFPHRCCNLLDRCLQHAYVVL